MHGSIRGPVAKIDNQRRMKPWAISRQQAEASDQLQRANGRNVASNWLWRSSADDIAVISAITFAAEVVRMKGRNAALLAAAAGKKMGTARVPTSSIGWGG